jgi:hypothetical protein
MAVLLAAQTRALKMVMVSITGSTGTVGENTKTSRSHRGQASGVLDPDPAQGSVSIRS